jgi:hypothetical protein
VAFCKTEQAAGAAAVPLHRSGSMLQGAAWSLLLFRVHVSIHDKQFSTNTSWCLQNLRTGLPFAAEGKRTTAAPLITVSEMFQTNCHASDS